MSQEGTALASTIEEARRRPIRWLRSWPREIPAGRPHVIDDTPRLVIADYDYRPLLQLAADDPDSDFCLLEWDMALDPDDRIAFERTARQYAGWPLVAPYRLRLPGQEHAVWAHRLCIGPADDGSQLRPIGMAERFCHYPALGLIYLPNDVLRQYAQAIGSCPAPYLLQYPDADLSCDRFTDHNFAVWLHHYSRRPPTRVAWSVRPAHLH